MKRRINRFLVTVTAFLSIWFAYLGHQLIGLTALDWLTKTYLWLVLALPFGLMLWLPAFHWADDSPARSRVRDALVWCSFVSMGLLSFILLFVVARDVLYLVIRDSRLYSTLAGGATLGAAVALLVLGMLAARRAPRVTHVDIPIAGLPPDFENYRIVQLSDMHISVTMQRDFVAKVVATVNALAADAVALTGDIFDGEVEELRKHFEPLAALRARDGRFYVTGNHEYYWGAEQWTAEATKLGFTPLINAHAIITRATGRILIAGVADFWAARNSPSGVSDPVAALAHAPPEVTSRILLAHQPASATAAAPLGFSLQLSGHTHGGQFIPWTLLVHLFHKFARGLYRFGDMWVYVNRGTGHWGPPVRLGSRSEITVVRLVGASPGSVA